MPFDPAPREVKVGEFQEFADAILRGCQLRPLQCTGSYLRGNRAACALGAMFVGLGLPQSDEAFEYFEGDDALLRAYVRKYHSSIWADNDSGNFTREQIAARIAAL